MFNDIDNLKPLEIIERTAKIAGLETRKPKSNCKKCFGRGYIGFEVKTNVPIACKCIYPMFDKNYHLKERK